MVDGPGWSFIKKFDKLKDGREAVLALKAQAEGTSAKLTRKQAAYASLASSAYLGPRKGFTFASYVTLHQSAHNELLDLDEPVSESKKVTDFLKGIRDPNLNTGKSIVLGDPGKLGDFEECQQYLSTVVQNMSAQTKSERQVSSAMSDGGNRGGGSSLVDRVKGGAYSDEQFRSLSAEDKKRVQKYRDDAKKKRKVKAKDRKDKRKLAKLKAEKEAVSDDDDKDGADTTSSNAGAQFGANGNKQKKSKS